MADYIGVVTNAGAQKIAAAIGGAALNLSVIRVGDGNGAPIVPAPAMTDLVRRVGVDYPIIAAGRDPVNANMWRVTALIPVGDGPFDIREIAVFDANGTMIAIANHVLVEKRTPAQGAAVEITTDIVFPVSSTAQVTVQVLPSASVALNQMLRAGFQSIESAALAAAPGNPVVGATYVVAANAVGAWAGLTGRLVQWTGSLWVAVDVPQGFIVVAQDRALDHSDRWLRRIAGGWASARANEDALGVVELATAAEVQAGVDATRVVTPAGLSARIATEAVAGLVRKATAVEIANAADVDAYVGPGKVISILNGGNIVREALPFPEVYSADKMIALSVAAKAGQGGSLAVTGGEIVQVGQDKGGGLGEARRAVVPATDFGVANANHLLVNSTYYLRGQFIAGVFTPYLQRGADTDAVPAGLVGTPNVAAGGGFDSSRLDILFARIVTGAAGTPPTLTRYRNAAVLQITASRTTPALGQTTGVNTVWSSGAESVFVASYATAICTLVFAIEWARKPSAVSVSGGYWVGGATTSQYVSAGANYVTATAITRDTIVTVSSTDYIEGQVWNGSTINWTYHIGWASISTQV